MNRRERRRAGGGSYILVAEDDDDVREMLVLMLEAEGYEVRGVVNGREALEQLRAGPLPCLVLLDLMMPVMDGWRFREEQERDPAIKGVPIVVVTGAGQPSESLPGGAVAAHLRKPIELKKLLRTVARYC